MSAIETQFQQVRDRIHAAENACGRAGAVKLLAVSKTKPARLVREAWHTGQRDFGENYVQEGIDKIQALQDLVDICWHFIGPLQSNKTRAVAEHFDWVHSVDRLKIAQRLSEQRPGHLPPLNICIQVNISDEDTKSGVSPEDAQSLAAEIVTLPNLALRGLMAIPIPTDDPAAQHAAFRAMSALLATLQDRWPEQALDTLSMGMSNDLEAAIEEGATMVRIGTALFGARDYS
ncbi:YggS family pyridoxal phosphate-dependent enzyme [Kistimonas scapharcae]|uniref:Pyridoxal phosphate homeostasis protein n=1 Tax=Kistimonas scapharcae TaxID=1036133 RepID=A0ABP8V7Z6_9GAMM